MLAFQNQQRPVYGRMPSSSDVIPSLADYDSYHRYENFPPSFDGPPTSEQMRAYEERLRLQAMKESYSRAYSSTTPITFGWGEGWGEVPRLARKPSEKLTFSKKMGIDRPDSVQMLAKSFFTRSSKKTRRGLSNSRSSSSLSLALQTTTTTEESAATRDNNVLGHVSRKNSKSGLLLDSEVSLDEQNKPQISEPYNFQHVTHTRHDHLPNLERTSRLDLLSEFSAIRAAQAPTHGTIKGIKTTDLHSENSSVEDLVNISRPKTSPHSPSAGASTEHRSPTPQSLSHARSCDNLRQAPPRPPRSPPTTAARTVIPPPRTSSRRASTLYEQFNPVSINTSVRPEVRTTFQKPKAFHLPVTPLKITHPAKEDEPTHSVTSTRMPAAGTWPLPTPPLESANRLPGLSEEFEARARATQQAESQLAINTGVQTPRTSIVVPKDESLDVSTIGVAISPTKHISLVHETWEDDIDYCYEHEAEADCEYNWSRASYESTTREAQSDPYPTMPSTTETDSIVLRQPRSRPTYLMPSPLDLPALSPVSNTSAPSPELRTPCGLQTQPSYPVFLSPSGPFQESHGFTLSPSLLIPKDYSNQMTLYHHDMIAPLTPHREIRNSRSVTDLILESYPLSLGDDTRSSTASFNTYRSSAASNSIASPATTISKSGSMESMSLLSRGPSFVLGHRSSDSKDSLPELTHSRSYNMLRGADREDGLSMKPPMLSIISAPSAALVDEVMRRFERASLVDDTIPCVLSPVAESFMEMPRAEEQQPAGAGDVMAVAVPAPLCTKAAPAPKTSTLHGRKMSAPLLSAGVGAVASADERAERFAKGRQRASSVAPVASGATSKAKAYSLFPQI